MSLLNLQASYFSIENPLRLLERCCNRFRYRRRVFIDRRELQVRWTARAERELQRLESGLVVELQLYFSCVVKKRVLFHPGPAGFDPVAVDDRFGLVFQPVAAAACDPEKFAASYPRGRQLSGDRARRMLPRRVELDYRRGNWEGQFHF